MGTIDQYVIIIDVSSMIITNLIHLIDVASLGVSWAILLTKPAFLISVAKYGHFKILSNFPFRHSTQGLLHSSKRPSIAGEKSASYHQCVAMTFGEWESVLVCVWCVSVSLLLIWAIQANKISVLFSLNEWGTTNRLDTILNWSHNCSTAVLIMRQR